MKAKKIQVAMDKGEKFYANGYASNGKFMIEREFSKRFTFGKQIDTLLDSGTKFSIFPEGIKTGEEAKIPDFSAIANSVKEEELIPLKFSGFTYQDKTDIYIHAKGIVMFNPKWRGLLLSTGNLQIQDKATKTNYPMAIVKDLSGIAVAYVMPHSDKYNSEIVDGCKEIANSVMTESEVMQ